MARVARRPSPPQEPGRLVSVVRVRKPHPVRCPHCEGTFELFAADWCACPRGPRSKVCAGCARCACSRPEYRDPRLWAVAPPAFVREGFDRLFVAYV